MRGVRGEPGAAREYKTGGGGADGIVAERTVLRER